METIIANCMIVLCTIASISQVADFCKTYTRTNVKLFRYILLCLSLGLSCCCNIVMILSYGTVICYIVFAIDRLARTLFMAELVLVSEDIIKIPPKFVSAFVSSICYASLALYFVDTVISGGVLERSRFGIFFRPQNPVHLILHFAFYMIYIVAMLAFVVFKASFISKKKDSYELYLIFGCFGISCFGFLSELFISIYSSVFIPTCEVCNLISIFFMQKLIRYHRSILLVEEDYEQDLLPNRVDAVFVLDDKLKVVFLNQRAKILASIFRDNYLGRKFTDIFDFTDEKIKELKSAEDSLPFGLSADYPLANRSVNMVIRHTLDKFGAIFSTTVIVYNMEEQSRYSDGDTYEQQIGDEDRKVRAESVAITAGARILLVDEDVLFLREFQNILVPYEVEVFRALNGHDAVDMIQESTYDLVFISEKMIRLTGMETAVKIRTLPGEYYQQIPLILVTENDINTIYTEFLNSGFTDYLNKPIEPKQINSVLTRWAWQRFDREIKQSLDDEFDVMLARKEEINSLIEDAQMFMTINKNDKLKFCIKGIKKCTALLGIPGTLDMASELEEACIFDDNDAITSLLEKIKNLVTAD